MRILLVMLVALAAGVGVEKPAAAQSGGWGAYIKRRAWRLQELRVCNLAAMFGQRARHWRKLFTQPDRPISRYTPSGIGGAILTEDSASAEAQADLCDVSRNPDPEWLSPPVQRPRIAGG